MAVRFLPPPADQVQASANDRENLAEVIEFRSRLQLNSVVDHGDTGGLPGTSDLDPGPEPDVEEPHTIEAVRSALDDAVRMLARRARSSGELRKELLALGHDHAEVEDVTLECESRLYLDDLGLARVLTENLRARKRASRTQIRMKLRERLLPDAVIEEAIGELDEDEEHDLLREAATERARKMGSLDRQTAERRLLGFLARRGWSGERAVRVVREVLDRDAQRSHSVICSSEDDVARSASDFSFRGAPVSNRSAVSRDAQAKRATAAVRSSVRFQ